MFSDTRVNLTLHEIKPYLHNIRYKVSNNIAIKVIKTRNSRIVQLSDRLLLWGIVEFVIKMVNCTVNCFLSFFSFAGSPFLLTKHIKLRSRFLLLCGLEMELNCSPTKDRCSYLHNWNAIIWNDSFVLRFNTLNLVCCFFSMWCAIAYWAILLIQMKEEFVIL